MKPKQNFMYFRGAKYNSSFKSIALMAMLFFTSLSGNFLIGQQICGFDEDIQPFFDENPQFINDFYNSKSSRMDDFMGGEPLPDIEIPIVFHVLYQNGEETIGTGGNILNSQILNAFNSLNDDFENSGIQFCLALRDANDNEMIEHGVTRTNASSAGYTGKMIIGQNETQLKSLSYFSNKRYLNVWVVSDLEVPGVSGKVLGIGYFPNTKPNNIDGIVMDRNHMGLGDWRVLTHEVGHYLGLLHTFTGDDPVNNLCPPLDDNLGDRMAMTQAHIRPSMSGLCPDGHNTCYPNDQTKLLEDISNNHMNYTSEICRTTFTDDQIALMISTLEQERASLLNSLGCVAVCNTDWTIDFYYEPQGIIQKNTNVFFYGSINNIQGSYNTKWNEDGELIGQNTLNFAYLWNDYNTFEICFQVHQGGCIKEKCLDVIIGETYNCIPESNECNIILNGNFEDINPTKINNSLHTEYFDFIEWLDGNILCNWINSSGTPTGILLNSGEVAISMFPYSAAAHEFTDGFNDILTTVNEVELINGLDYNLEIELKATKSCLYDGTRVGLEIGFFDNVVYNIPHNPPLPTFIYNDYIDLADCWNNEQEFVNDVNYTKISFPFTYFESYGKHLYFRAVDQDLGSNVHLFVKEINITQCCPIPQINVDSPSPCEYYLSFENLGDPADFTWNIIGTNMTGTSSNFLFTPPLPDIYTVCLTMTCDEGNRLIEECIEIDARDANSCCTYGTISPINQFLKYCEEESFQTNATIPIPDGFYPCSSDLDITPSDGISEMDYYLDDSGQHNQLHVSFNTDNPNNAYEIRLCGPNGELGCYYFGTSGIEQSECTSCTDLLIPVVAICDDSNPTDMNFVYSGSIDITINTSLFTPCGSFGSMPGFSGGTPINNGSYYTIPFTINTNNPGSFNMEGTLCFTNGTDTKCFRYTISIPEPCEILTCLEEPETVTLECQGAIGGDATFLFSDQNLFDTWTNNGYELCEGNALFSSIGTAEILNDRQGQMSNIIKLTISCEDLEENDRLTLLINFCKDGEVVCVEISISLIACEACLLFDPRNREEEIKSSVLIFPNPSKDVIFIELERELDGQLLEIIDITGKTLSKQLIYSGQNEIDISHLNEGLYLFRVHMEDKLLVNKILITN